MIEAYSLQKNIDVEYVPQQKSWHKHQVPNEQYSTKKENEVEKKEPEQQGNSFKQNPFQ